MGYDDFPALYASADKASSHAQKLLLLLSRINNLLLIFSATLAFASYESRLYAVLCALVLIASLALAIYGRYNDLQAQWYQCRALAESIKTASWRFVMNADPFSIADESLSLEKFRNLLNELLRENRSIGGYLSDETNQREEVTSAMLQIRRDVYENKQQLYLETRIEDQKNWYAKKSRANRKASKMWFMLLCLSYGCAIVLSLLQIAYPDSNYFPVDIFVVVASCIISWTQLKRFDELASAYSLTSHEIGIIKSRFSSVNSADVLSNFVSDAENAFSREHTQWAARRDH
jgi:hypothetical protein